MPDPASPVQPTTLEGRILAALQKMQDRMDGIVRTRPTTSIGTDPLPVASVPGTRHFDTNEKRLWVYADGDWLSSDSRRWTAVDTSQVGTTSGRWTDLGGPTLSFTLPYSTVVNLHADAEMHSATWACSAGTCLTRAEIGLNIDGVDVSTRTIVARSYNTWERRVSTAYANQAISFDSDGEAFPRGGFIGIALPAGAHTISMRYAAINETAGGPQPTTTVLFRNRALHLLGL